MQSVKFILLTIIISCASTINAQECGNVKYSDGLIYGGNYTKRDQWPWLCSLHDVESDEFFCGSTLISSRHVVTGMAIIFGVFRYPLIHI